MNGALALRPDARFAGAGCTLLSMGLCVIGLGGSLARLPAEVPPLYLTETSIPGPGVSLVWDPSPDSDVVGYFVCWGTARGQCTNQLNASNATSTTIRGFTTNTVYYFNVVAYNAIGQQADPSNEVQYSQIGLTAFLAPTLAVQPSLRRTSSAGIRLSFQGSAGATYVVLASQDLIEWDSIWTTNCATNIAVIFSATDATNYVQRFYRLVQTNE